MIKKKMTKTWNGMKKYLCIKYYWPKNLNAKKSYSLLQGWVKHLL